MDARGINQAALAAMSGVPKSAINQYLKGKFKPKQNRTCILAEVLRVDPAWLMGYAKTDRLATLSEWEYQLVERCREDMDFRVQVDTLLDASESARMFRAAHSTDGKTPPSIEQFSASSLQRLESAPDSDEDL